METKTLSNEIPKPEDFGAKLFIDPQDAFIPVTQVAIDVETDEKDRFVGIGICWNRELVYYFTDLGRIKKMLETASLIGHGYKFDFHMLRKWGINVRKDQMLFDTSIASYVVNPTKESHHLKDLSREILNMAYPTYKEMVGKGRSKLTLDKQDTLRVARYCGCDALATFRLYQHFETKMTTQQKHLFYNLEMPILRLLFQMEEKGITVDVDCLKGLGAKWEEEIETLESCFPINVRSPKQVKQWLKEKGIDETSTDKNSLERHSDDPAVELLIRHRKVAKLHGYVKGLLELPTLPKVHTRFSQVSSNAKGEWFGIRTGRLSSREPNLQNIPTRTEEGNLLRKVFIPEDGKVFIDADYAQIEYRLLAHFSQDSVLLKAFREGKDVHEETAKVLGVDRYLGKTLNFAAIYGAHPKKITQTVNTSPDTKVKITEEQAQKFLKTYWQKLPRVQSWIWKVKNECRRSGGVKTILGRWIPIKSINSASPFERWGAERQAVNYTIQGSAADIIKLAMIKLDLKGLSPVLQVHDELLFESPNNDLSITGRYEDIREIMESVVGLSIPLEVAIETGNNWDEAKS